MVEAGGLDTFVGVPHQGCDVGYAAGKVGWQKGKARYKMFKRNPLDGCSLGRSEAVHKTLVKKT